MKYVAYYRSSIGKQKQGVSGIQEQKHQVRRAIHLIGEGEIIAEYEDIETSDKSNKRLNLQRAVTQARKSGAVIVVSSFDRISQNVNYIMSLMTSDVTFATVERVTSSRSVLCVLASFVHENDASESIIDADGRTPQRTKYAMKLLAPPTARYLGSHNLTPVARQKGAQAVKQKALDNPANRAATVVALQLRNEGKNFTEIAFELNSRGYTTATGKQFQPVQVLRLLQRADDTRKTDKSQRELFG